jgi:hypothetical protein
VSAKHRMLRRGAKGIMMEFLPRVMRDDLGHGFGEKRAQLYPRDPGVWAAARFRRKGWT